jgi:hypothetical protein
MGKRCPWLKKCDPECVFYRKGLRYFEDERKPIPFEECGFNIGFDCLEQLVSRSIGKQKATEEGRNKTHELLEFFKNMVAESKKELK